jgi:hypothetical protein
MPASGIIPRKCTFNDRWPSRRDCRAERDWDAIRFHDVVSAGHAIAIRDGVRGCRLP